MKKTFITSLLISSALLNAKIEILDRIAIIVDDGVVMESQINKAMVALEEGYREQNIQLPPQVHTQLVNCCMCLEKYQKFIDGHMIIQSLGWMMTLFLKLFL